MRMVGFCSREGRAAWSSRCLAPQLVPSQTESERNFEQCSPSPWEKGASWRAQGWAGENKRPHRQDQATLASRRQPTVLSR